MANSQDPSATLEKVREMIKMYEALREDDFYGEFLHSENKIFNDMILNNFPSIASLCLEQAEEIKRLRGALALAQSMILGGEKMSETSEKIFSEALSPQSK